MANLLLTRSTEENDKIEQQLGDLNLNIIKLPLLEYYDEKIDFRRFSRYQTIVITSKHAAQIVGSNYLFKAQCLVVGEVSAQLLEANPHLSIKAIFPNVDELYNYVETSHDLGSILYLCGDIVSRSLKNIADTKCIYRSVYTSFLPSHESKKLSISINYVFLFSKNAVKQMIYVFKHYDLLRLLAKSVVIVISEKVASDIKPFVKNVLVAPKPSSAEMIKILRTELCK